VTGTSLAKRPLLVAEVAGDATSWMISGVTVVCIVQVFCADDAVVDVPCDAHWEKSALLYLYLKLYLG